MNKLFTNYFKQPTGVIREERAAIEIILKSEPSTITSIVKITGYAKDLILWNLLAMMKWGVVEIASEEGDELTYKIKEV